MLQTTIVEPGFIMAVILTFILVWILKPEKKKVIAVPQERYKPEFDMSTCEVTEEGAVINTSMTRNFQLTYNCIFYSINEKQLSNAAEMVELFRLKYGKSPLYDDLYAELAARMMKIKRLEI